MTYEIGVFLAYACGFFAVVFLGKLFRAPLKIIWKLVINSSIGFIILLAINFFGEGIGIEMPINLITAIIIGFLGLPGIITIFIINYI